MTRDGTTSGSPYALGIHGIRVLLPGLRVGASRFGVDGINATPERKINRLTKRSSTMKRFMSELVALRIRRQSEDGFGIVVPGPSPVSDIAIPGIEGRPTSSVKCSRSAISCCTCWNFDLN